MKTLYTTYNNFAKRFVMTLMVLMTVGVGSMFAAEYEEMLTLDVAKNAPTGSTSTQLTIDEIKSYLQNAAPNTSNIKSATNKTGDVYKGKGSGGDGIPQQCLKIGKASGSGGFTFTIADSFDDIAKVDIIGYGWKATSSISVNGAVAQKPSIAASQTTFSFELAEATKTITISVTTSAVCVTSIKLYKAAPSGYAVTWDKNGRGDVSDVSKFPTTASSLTLQSLSATGYTNTGWKANVDVKNGSNTIKAENLINNGTTVTLSQATTFTAQWTPKQVTITWNANGGIVTPSTSNYIYDGSSVTLPTPTRDGYNFKGWYTSGGTQITDIGTNNKPASDVTYYAQWTEKQLTNYRTSCADPCEQLGDATGLSVQTDYVENGLTYVKFSWTPANNTKDHAIKQVICIGKVGEEKKCTDLEGNQVWSGDLRSKLTPGEYEWTIQAIGNGETYCDGEVISGPNFTIEEPLTDNCRWVEIALEDITPEDEIVVTMGNDEIGYALGTEKITNSPKSQAITITSGMIDINQDFDYSKYTWSISAVTGGYTLQPYGTTDTYLYGVTSYISIGNNNTNNIFTIFTSPENGNKCFMYTIEDTPYYLGHGTEDGQTAWKRVTSYTNLLKSNTLKFYKKTCLPADEYWINYNLSNVTCITNPIPSQIANDGEDLLLEFSANDGYKLPETISVKMGETEIGNDENYCVWGKETGALLIVAELITDNITITIEGCERLATPTNLSVTNITSTSARLSWNAVTNADEYRVCIMDGETQLEELTTPETYVNVMNLKKNSFYTWDVVAEADDYCESQPTAWIEFTTLDVYTVTFNSNGGTAVESQTVDAGSKIKAPSNPSAAGYTFNYWYTTDANVPFDFNTPITGNTTLYAKWTPNVYTITFYKQSGTGGTDNATVTFNSNNYSVSTIEAPTREKYAFGGYYTEQYGAGIQVVDAEGNWLKNVAGYTDANGNWIKAENTHLYAKWTAIYTITWVVNNNTETPYHTSTVLSGSTIDQLPNPPADNLFADCDVNAFVGWSTDNIGFDPDPTAPTDLFKTVEEAQNKIGAISADKKFYAVYASASNGADSYKLATKVEDLFDGQTVIIAKDNGALEIDNNTIDKVNISPDGNGNLSNVTDNIKWTLEASGTHWKLKNNGGYLGVTSTTSQTAVSVTETNNVWQIAKSTASGDYFYICQPNTTIGLQYYNSRWQIYSNNSVSSSTNFTLKIYVPNVTNFITRCTALPDPVWGGATIDNAVIPVNCGSTTSNSHAAQISFPAASNYKLYKDITIEASSGFVLSTSRDAVEYPTSVTLSPTQSGTNAGTFANKYVYVRAVAPAMSDEDFTGTITISGQQIATQTITVTADVTCTQCTLTFNDQGQTKTVSGFAGTTVETPEPWAGICTEPIQYVFDGWAETPVANDTEEYEKIDFSAYTMPDNNTTVLYAVYRYAEEGGEPVDGFVKVTEALSDWTGDYVIVDDENLFAIKNAYRENTNSNKTLAGETVTIENDKVVSPSANIVWSFSKNGNGYTMYNVATDIYAGIGTHSRAAVLSEIIADENNIKIIFDDAKDIAKVSGIKNNRCFQYYVTNDEIKEWRTYDSDDSRYNTGYLYRLSNKTLRYTSSLVCGTIEAENAIVTSTVGQTVKVYVPITLEYSDVASITGTSDNEAFTVVTKNDVAVGESNIEVHYKPTAYVNTANQEETATITLTTSNGATTSFNITGRCLPEAFVIAAKWDGYWYALPANCTSSLSSTEGLLIEVDDVDNPTRATQAPASAKYGIREVIPSRQTDHGQGVVFTERYSNDNKEYSLYNNGTSANLQVYSQYSNYAANNPERYEWTPSTTDFVEYTLTNANSSRKITLNNSGVFSATTASGQVRLLPATFYEPAPVQVLKWKENSVIVMYTGAETTATTQVGTNAVSAAQTLENQKLTHGIYELTTTQALTGYARDVLVLYFGANTKVEMEIPLIVSGNVTASANGHDVVILENSKLTAAATKYSYKDVYVYGGGKLAVPASTSLGVNNIILRAGGIATNGAGKEATYQYIYPQVELKGTLSSTKTDIKYEYVTDYDHWYHFVLPFNGNIKSITYPTEYYGDHVALDNTGSWVIKRYDGATRATGNYDAWKDIEVEGKTTTTAGHGYIFWGAPKKVSVNGGAKVRQQWGIQRITMPITAGNAITAENGDKTIEDLGSYANVANNSGAVNDQGWNLIGNPYMVNLTTMAEDGLKAGKLKKEIVDGNWTGKWINNGDDIRYLTIPSDHFDTYEAKTVSAAKDANNLVPGRAFFVQLEGEANGVTFAAANRASLMPQHLAAQNTEVEIETGIILSNETMQDEVNFWIKDGKTNDYEYNADYPKTPNNTNFNIYGVHINGDLSWVAVSPEIAEESMPIGYQVPAAGTYMLSLSETYYSDDLQALYVTDHAMSPELTVDLLSGPYEFSVNQAETNNQRFTVHTVVRQNSGGVTTGMEELNANDKQQPYKFMYQDKMYIYNNGVLYDATGKQVKTINK